LSLNIFIG